MLSSSSPQQCVYFDYKLEIFPCKETLYLHMYYIVPVCFTFPWADLSNLKIFEDGCNGFIGCMQEVWAAEGQLSLYCAYKGFASQGQRMLFLKLSVKNQSRHFYHIKQSEAFNRYVTGKKSSLN